MSDPGGLAGMTRLAPGVYDDGKGGLHLDAGEFLEANGIEANAENREKLARIGRKIAEDNGLDYAADG